MRSRMKFLFPLFFSFLVLRLTARAATPPTTDFARVSAIFAEHCLDCHAAQDPEGKLVLETFDDLTRGGESGPAITPGQSENSLLIKMVEGKIEKDGKTKV